MALGIVNVGGSSEQKKLTLQLNGTTAADYDGSESKSVNITPATIGLGSVDNTHDKDKTVKKAGEADAVEWSGVKNKPTSYPPSAHSHDLNAMINGLTTGTSTPTDADYFVSQYAGGGTTTTTYHRRPLSALWSWIKAKADSLYQAKGSYAAASHSHDDRYYTESEMNTKLAGKSDTNHSHAWSAITGKPSSFTPSSHTHDATDTGAFSGVQSSGTNINASQRYIRFSNGTQICHGRATNATIGKEISFPAAFCDTLISVCVSQIGDLSDDFYVTNVKTTSFTWNKSGMLGGNIHWIAIGHWK